GTWTMENFIEQTIARIQARVASCELRVASQDISNAPPTAQNVQLTPGHSQLATRNSQLPRIICGLSGGVDSSVVAALLHKAVGDQLVCIFVNNGLLRKNERELVESTFRDHFHIDLHVSDASQQFLDALAGVTDPQEKRRIIGKEFI